MQTTPLDAATDSVRKLANRKIAPLSWLEATFAVVEGMSTEVATQVLDQLLRQRFLAIYDADMAQMLAQKLGREVQWSHARFPITEDRDWEEGRGEQ